MKKIRFLIPLIIIAALAITVFALEQPRLLTTAQTVAPAATQSAEQTTVQITSQTVAYPVTQPASAKSTVQPTGQETTQPTAQTTTQTTAQTTTQPAAQPTAAQNTTTDIVAINGISVDRKRLIDNLDKTTDETINYAYGQSTDNITIGNVYEGNFSDSGKPELLVIFKLLGMPHAGGLDCSVTALYDRNTLELISQKTFPYDECKFAVHSDNKQRGYLLFVGSTTYQGRSQYILLLYRPGGNWEEVFSAKPRVISELLDDENNIKYELKDDGSVWVYRPASFDEESHQFKWRHVYSLVWNMDTCTLDETVPKTYTDADGNKVVDAVSVSPDGKYAISVIHESGRVFLYDIEKNMLAGEFYMPAQDFGFLWSPNSKRVCVTRTARVWIESSVIDAVSLKSAHITAKEVLDAFSSAHIKLDYNLNDNRPDPYITPIEWSPDGKKILMFYQWTDTEYNRQSGIFIYNTVSGGISRMTRNEAEAEGGNLPYVKPYKFKW
ncbi:MAG TPA: hypothetical protein VHT96_01120 [Clostridia bacterium]|nr:hypothetical protein [Clostridia bacterium]